MQRCHNIRRNKNCAFEMKGVEEPIETSNSCKPAQFYLLLNVSIFKPLNHNAFVLNSQVVPNPFTIRTFVLPLTYFCIPSVLISICGVSVRPSLYQ